MFQSYLLFAAPIIATTRRMLDIRWSWIRKNFFMFIFEAIDLSVIHDCFLSRTDSFFWLIQKFFLFMITVWLAFLKQFSNLFVPIECVFHAFNLYIEFLLFAYNLNAILEWCKKNIYQVSLVPMRFYMLWQ